VRYTKVRRLGEGAGGEVLLVEDRLRGRQRVALKRLSSELDPHARAALEREFLTLASVSLPGVAHVFDFGVVRDPSLGEPGPFFTRAFIEGLPLDVGAAQLSEDARVRLFARVAARIGGLQRAGIVHGDIKPANVIVDPSGEPSVIDFGLASSLFANGRVDSLGGTPAFMAPELFEGARPSIATDMYALGCTLWMLMTGEPPHGPEGRRARSTKLKADPPIPTGVSEIAHGALLVAKRAFARDPAERFPTVGEMLASLERIQSLGECAITPWISPPSRGHADFAHEIDGAVSALAQTGGSLLLIGDHGSGRTTLMRAAKWRHQLRDWSVIELPIAQGDGLSPVVALLEQAHLLCGDSLPSGPQGAPSQWAEQCVEALSRIDSSHPILLLADDLDRAERVVGELLRAVVHSDRALPIVVVASARDATHAAQELCATRTLSVPALDRDAVAGLVSDGLGSVDATVTDAVWTHSRGLPARIVAALRLLSTSIAPTAADVRALTLDGDEVDRLRVESLNLNDAQRKLLALVDLLEVASAPMLASLVPELPGIERDMAFLVERGVLSRDRAGVRIVDARLARSVRSQIGREALRTVARRAIATTARDALDPVACARLHVAAGDGPAAAVSVPAALAQLEASRAYLAAAELAAAWLENAEAELRPTVLSRLAELQHRVGDLDAAAATSNALLSYPYVTPQQRAEAATLLARSLSARGLFDDALTALDQAAEHASPPSLARVFRERAKIHLLRGSYDAVAEDARRGLDIAPPSDLVRVELLTSLGMAASYQADQAKARDCYQQALDLARAEGSKRDMANALGYLAIASLRSGDVESARGLFAECLEVARDLNDVGAMANFSLNLGAMEFYLGAVGAAEDHYASAVRLARRAGRANTALQARNNLAHVHIYFGLFEQAQAEAQSVAEDAERAGLRMIRAQSVVLLADLHARAGNVDAALVRYDEASRLYADLKQEREVADVHLDAAEAILDRGGPADVSAAASRLASARALIQSNGLTDFALRLSMLLCRARVGSGEHELALEELNRVIEEARERRNRDVLWGAFAASARAHEALGSSFLGRRCDQQAVEVLEEIALQVPRQHRDAFWSDPRRREVRRRAALIALDTTGAPLGGDLRRDRLLEIIKRLASEHDLERLLERVTESAVELSGAEHGFVLLVGADSKLVKRVQRGAEGSRSDPHAAFSSSIAEAVLIDGEPIVTVDAASDQRVSEYLSVHRLALRSLACLPIRSQRGTVGVLYLEHRRYRGRFSEADMDVLHAFADQAAIAVENARLIADVEQRRADLESANATLEQARREIQTLLDARTEQLHEARQALEAGQTSSLIDGNRHGMIGRSAGMRRVCDTIDRLGGNDVPVTIVGESGTGKELVARAIHRVGARASGPFVVVNCAAIPETLVESELFGHVRGAFTGADRDKQGLVTRASGGVLFLDEVSEMSPKMQIDLLRVVQEGVVRPVGSEHDVPVDVRFVAASNRSLDEMVANKLFREDLYYRLNVVQIQLPPLRERREDIPLLAEHFLRTFAKRDGRPAKRLSPEAITTLCAHLLPGNVRQLEHLLLNAWVLVEATVIRAEHLALEGRLREPAAHPVVVVESVPPPENLEEHRDQERARILASLEKHSWNRVQAAASLGMPRRTFYRRLREYDIL